MIVEKTSRAVVTTVFLAVMLVTTHATTSRAAEVSPPGKSYAPYPAPDSGYVTDKAGLLPAGVAEQIEQSLWEVEEKTGVEIAVVTINSISDFQGTANESIETFATALFNAYGVGNLPSNNGVLLLIARNDRKARIELGKAYGRGRDNDARAIMNNVIIPQFKANRYAEGITAGVKEIIKEFAGIQAEGSSLLLADIRISPDWLPAIITGGIVIVLLLVATAYSLYKNGKRGWGWVLAGFLFLLVLVVYKIISEALYFFFSGEAITPYHGSSDSWSSGGFGGGFGGGSSGGGGATGSW